MSRILLFTEIHYQGRFAGFFLYVSNTTNKDKGQLCMHNTKRPTPQMTIDCLTRGRYVIFYNERQSGVTYPDYYSSEIFNELCEVEVYGRLSFAFITFQILTTKLI